MRLSRFPFREARVFYLRETQQNKRNLYFGGWG